MIKSDYLTRFPHLIWVCFGSFFGSVVDPDMYVFGPPGSKSVIICTDPDLDPSSNKQKNKKNLDI